MIQSADDSSYLVEVADGVLRLSFNRPEFGNAMPSTATTPLTALFRAAQADRTIRCILVRGEGRIFSAGGDVAGFQRSLSQTKRERAEDFGRRLGVLRGLVDAVMAFDRPIVASVRGAAAGAGLLYPLVADYVIGDETATFVFAHQKVGLSPDGGVTVLLPGVVGERMARTLLLTAAKVDADEAKALGMLHRIVAGDALEQEAAKMARRFARAPQKAIRLAKTLLRDAPLRSAATQLDAETAGIVACVTDDDFEEGVNAFLEKRAADFPSTRTA